MKALRIDSTKQEEVIKMREYNPKMKKLNGVNITITDEVQKILDKNKDRIDLFDMIEYNVELLDSEGLTDGFFELELGNEELELEDFSLCTSMIDGVIFNITLCKHYEVEIVKEKMENILSCL